MSVAGRAWSMGQRVGGWRHPPSLKLRRGKEGGGQNCGLRKAEGMEHREVIADLGLRIEEKAENSGVRIQETGGKD